jgi:hypothetical protein
MFACNSILVVVTALVPDVCKTPTPAGPVPLPYPNIATSATHIPSVFHVMFGIGLAENLMTQGTISQGDTVGVAGGVVSQVFMGPDRYLLGSFKLLVGGMFAMRMTSLTGHNGMPVNTVGFAGTPGCVHILICG